MNRQRITDARRVVLKLGTRVITHDDGGLALGRLFGLIETAAALRKEGREVLIVSSGAVGLGRESLGLAGELMLADRQACAAVGQTRLMQLYSDGFSRLGLVAGQLLLTQSDFDHRVRYLNLRSTLEAMLAHGAVPIINENDAVATEELAFVGHRDRPVFGDNDQLSALVASKLDADLLVLLTDVAGVYDRDPRRHKDAKLLDTITTDGAAEAGPSASGVGRGGMTTKLSAARTASLSGCDAVICSGRHPDALPDVLAGRPAGTFFPAAESSHDARKRWIAFAAAPRGVLHLDDGAVRAVRDRGASLLAVGVERIDGDFESGDIVEMRDSGGVLIARGMVWCDAGAARRWVAGDPPDHARNHHALVHRNHMAVRDDRRQS
ncbi:MAG: glutamate 5-kinase [Deltaproteobacteria bacterium]|nr:glutamate 5-kinase [Deltaproteobacteria bacterium]